LTLLPQAHETVQELKLAVNEWVGGYWLGPYSLRIPQGKGRKTDAEVKERDGEKDLTVQIKEGERLSEWLEVGDVFAGFEESDERVLEVIRGESDLYMLGIQSDNQNRTLSSPLDKLSSESSTSSPLPGLPAIPLPTPSPFPLDRPSLSLSEMAPLASRLTRRSKSLWLDERAKEKRRWSR